VKTAATRTAIVLIICAAGAYLRLSHYLVRRSLWLDESMLALNIASRSFIELLRPLDYNQSAPILFLWIERAIVGLAGVGELALRAFPMAAGLALPLLLWPVARSLLGQAGALAAVGLATFSPTLVRYANEAKPYGTDALATVLLLWAALAVEPRGHSPVRWAVLLAAGLFTIGVSTPGVFMAGAVLVSVLLRALTVREQRAPAAACAVAWTGAALVLYTFIYRPVANNPYQQQAYEAAFLFPGPGFLSRARLAVPGTILPTFAGLGSVVPAVAPAWLAAAIAALLLGLAFVVRRNGWQAGVLLGLPLAFAAFASALRCYPLGVPRLMVFASPLLILMAGGAVDGLGEALRGRARWPLSAGLAALCVTPMAWAGLRDTRHPFLGEDAASLVETFRERRRVDEPIYVGAKGIPSWVFYTTNWQSPDRERLAFYARAASSGPSFENAPSRGRLVNPEGRDLVYRKRERIEILGIATGRQWRWPAYSTPGPDEGWAANEAARIAAEANPCAWLYFTRLSERANKPLIWEIDERYRRRPDFVFPVPGGVLYHCCFPVELTRSLGGP
jgi:Dolichyl-phosphate-mannose-protein mannosyltransferase